MNIDGQHLLEKIREIHEQRKTGSLELAKQGDTISVFFDTGLIAAAGSSISQLQLGKILTGKGLLQWEILPKLVATARRKRIVLGRAAVSRNLMDEAELKDGVRDQIVQAMTYGLMKGFEIRAFKEAPFSIYMPAKLDFERLILELARNNLKPFRPDPDRLIFLNNGMSLSHLPWYPQELSVLSHLKTPCTLQDLAAATGMEYARLDKILGVFNTLKLLGEVEASSGESTAIVKSHDFSFKYLTPEIQDTAVADKLETLRNPSSFISEQFKNLKVRIGEAAALSPLRVIAVSSPQPEEGKSLVSVNFAVSLSKDLGRKVALVDCDLRSPSLQKFLGISVDPGLLGYLETDHLEPHCYMRRLNKLYFMTAGGIAENPIELLSNTRMQDLVAYLKAEFDTVILDCPPFAPISDAQILTGLADGLLMVIRCGKTTYGTTERAFRNMDKKKLIGVVFNDVKPMMFNTQYHHSYYHSYYHYGSAKLPRRSKNYLDQ